MDNMVGYRIKKRRKELRLTQKDIQKSTGISNGNLSDIENGNRLPSAGALASLSEALNISVDWILFGDSHTREQIIRKEDILCFTHSEEAFLNCFRQLSKDDQEEVLGIMNMKIQRKRKKERSSDSPRNAGADIA